MRGRFRAVSRGELFTEVRQDNADEQAEMPLCFSDACDVIGEPAHDLAVAPVAPGLVTDRRLVSAAGGPRESISPGDGGRGEH